jgi:hypothetical protein
MDDLHNTTPPTEPHKSTSTSIQEPAPSSDLTAAGQVSESGSNLVDKLIGTTELCEQILGYLSCIELCRAKCVCRTFRDVIDRSLMLQRHLFLAPCTEAPPEGSVDADDEWHALYDFHPLLAFDHAQVPNPRSDFQIQLRPSQSHAPTGDRFITCYSHGPSSTLNRLTQTFENFSGVYDHSSLREMYLSNPPSKQVRISYWNTSRQCVKGNMIFELGGILSCSILDSDKGVTFGQVFEWVEKCVSQQLKTADSVRPTSSRTRFVESLGPEAWAINFDARW